LREKKASREIWKCEIGRKNGRKKHREAVRKKSRLQKEGHRKFIEEKVGLGGADEKNQIWFLENLSIEE